jgi:PhnB protein
MASFIPEGHHTLTGYPVVQDAAGLIDFLKTVFDAQEKVRAIGGAGGIHAEMRIGDCMLMLGGGGPELKWAGESRPMAFHVYVPDTDVTYQLALDAGALSMQEPADQFWGKRTANVQDPFGNHWYISTRLGEKWFYDELPILQPYLHPIHAVPLIDFLSSSFGAEEWGRYTSPEGKILHTTLRMGNASLEITEAAGPYQPMPSMFYLYMPDVDAAYDQALVAGATSVSAPVDQAYGDRSAGVTDPFGNTWYMATHLE